MNATHTIRTQISAWRREKGPFARPNSVLYATAALLCGLVPASAEEEKKRAASGLAFRWQRPTELPLPPELANPGRRGRIPPASSLRTAPTTASVEIARKAPWISDLIDVDLFAGYYEFDEGPEDDYSVMKAGLDMAITNTLHFEASYYEDHDLDASSGFVGLWASLPLGDRKDDEGEKGVVRSLWNAVTPSGVNRLRTRKSAENEGKSSNYEHRVVPVPVPVPVSEQPAKKNERPGLFSRVFGSGSSESRQNSAPAAEKAEKSAGPVRKIVRRLGRKANRR